MHEVRSALLLAEVSAGNSIAAKIAMIAMTTSNSIKVKAVLPYCDALVLDILATSIVKLSNFKNARVHSPKSRGIKWPRDLTKRAELQTLNHIPFGVVWMMLEWGFMGFIGQLVAPLISGGCPAGKRAGNDQNDQRTDVNRLSVLDSLGHCQFCSVRILQACHKKLHGGLFGEKRDGVVNDGNRTLQHSRMS
jgi:hypothetical protein